MNPTVLSKEAFEAYIRMRMNAQNSSFVATLYDVIDAWTAEKQKTSKSKFACCAGCSFCCNQIVMATEIEWIEIRRFIEKLETKERYWFVRRLYPSKRDWRKWYRENERARSNPAKLAEAWFSKPCPFLVDGKCSIYPVRPIDCRTMASTKTCASWEHGEGVVRFPYDWDIWANNLILEEQGRLTRMAASPLHHWIDVTYF